MTAAKSADQAPSTLPPVRRAMVSPWSLGAASTAGLIALVVGWPVSSATELAAVAVTIGAGWVAGAGVALRQRRRLQRPRPERIDPFTVGEPWRQYVQQALSAQHRFERAVHATTPGPLRDRLSLVGQRLTDAISEVWRIASSADTIEDGLSTIDTRGARHKLELLEASDDLDPHNPATASALQAQLDTAARMQRVTTDAQNRLRVLDARLDELVARTVELSLGGSTAAVGGLGDDVEVLVQEMEALRQAVDEVDHLSRPPDGVLPPPETGQPPA
jgi:hypothetical protein